MSPTARAGTRRVSRTRLRGKLALLATAAALSLTAVTVTAAAAQADANVQISGPATALAGAAYTYTVTDPITPAQHADGSFIDFTLTGAAASITAESDNDSANVYCDAVSSAEYQCTDYAPSVSTWVLTFTVLPLAAGTVTAGVTLDDNDQGTFIGSASTTTTTTGNVPAPTVTGVSPADGVDIGGDPVTITGTNLAGATAVTFGPGNDATNVYCTATSCTAVSPPGADGTVDVQVTTSVASATSSADQFTYLPVIGIAGPASAVQAGTPYTYTVTVPDAEQEFANPSAVVTTSLSGAAAAFTAVTSNDPGDTACTLASAQVTCTVTAASVPAYLLTLTVTPAAAGTVTAATTLGGGGPGSNHGNASTTTTITAPPAPAVTSVTPATGTTAGGTAVTITGANLAGATAVTFGGTPATAVSCTATTCTATSPAGAAGTVNVQVTTPAGTSPVTSADKYTYVTPFTFTGFFLPVFNPPAVNLLIAGLPVNLGFALGGNKGLTVIAAGYPQVQRTNCATGAPIGSPQAAATVANVGLVYIPLTGTYLYAWQTSTAWHGTCQTFTLKLTDGSTHTAKFHF